jgi:hypothetical protein
LSASPTLGFSATLTVSDGASSAQQAFSFPVSFTLPGGNVSKVDYSYMGQATRDRHFTMGLIDNGDLEAEIFATKADYARLVALRAVLKSWVVTFPDDGTGTPHTYTFNGFLSEYSASFEINELVKAKLKVTIDGGITEG